MNEAFNLAALKQDRMRRVFGDQAMVAPHRNKARLFMQKCLVQPVGVFAPFAATVDERSSEYVVVFHAGISVPKKMSL